MNRLKLMIMPEGPALTLNPDFFMYQAYAAQVNREIAFVDAGSDLTFDLETILTKIDEAQPSFLLMEIDITLQASNLIRHF